jgi:DNA ligase (NAD+)
MNDALHRFNYAEADILSTQYLVINNSLWNQKEEKSNITGKTFVITGKLNNFKNRGLLQTEIEKHGGHVSGAVSLNTSYLVNNDISSSSSKNVKAKQLGIPIITEEELLAMF